MSNLQTCGFPLKSTSRRIHARGCCILQNCNFRTMNLRSPSSKLSLLMSNCCEWFAVVSVRKPREWCQAAAIIECTCTDVVDMSFSVHFFQWEAVLECIVIDILDPFRQAYLVHWAAFEESFFADCSEVIWKGNVLQVVASVESLELDWASILLVDCFHCHVVNYIHGLWISFYEHIIWNDITFPSLSKNVTLCLALASYWAMHVSFF